MNFFSTYSFNNKNNDFATVFKENKVVHILKDYSKETDSYFRELASQCGYSLIYEEDPITGVIDVDKWTEIKYDPEKAHDTYKSSNKSQPLHTDYGYFSFEIYAAFFYCAAQAEFGGATTFIDVDTIVNVLKNVNPILYQAVQQQKIHFGRQDNPLANNDDFILQQDALGWKINWNYYRALGDLKNKELVEDFHGFLNHYIEKSGELTELKLQPGEGVFFQDRRVLHGRNSFVGFRQLNKGGIAKELSKDILEKIRNNK